jgi:hypothetical protein
MFQKELLKDGDIILFHTGGFSPISFLIRQMSESYWNHTGMIVIEDKVYVIEAINKVAKTDLDKYLDNKVYDFKVVRLKKEVFKDEEEYNTAIIVAIVRIKSLIGKRYDYLAMTWLFLMGSIVMLFRKLEKYIKWNPFQQRSDFFCSELICSVYYKVSSKFDYLFQGKTRQACDTTTPKDIGKSDNVEYITGNKEKI